MSNVEVSEDGDTQTTVTSILVKVLVAIRSSFVAFVFAFGVVMLAAGVALQEGVGAGLLGIFGVSAMVYAVLGYAGLKLIGYT